MAAGSSVYELLHSYNVRTFCTGSPYEQPASAHTGRNYSREFGTWMKQHGFGSMRASDRSHAIELHETSSCFFSNAS